LWGTAKAVLRGKFIALSAYIKKKAETPQINNLMMHLNSRKARTNLTQNKLIERNYKDQG
jgi:hypothetical protein